jgi:ATPase subunit of ABC transporter with duplicated ATPase domains
VIAQALNAYQGAMIMVSHDTWFTSQLEGFEVVDLGKLVK